MAGGGADCRPAQRNVYGTVLIGMRYVLWKRSPEKPRPMRWKNRTVTALNSAGRQIEAPYTGNN